MHTAESVNALKRRVNQLITAFQAERSGERATRCHLTREDEAVLASDDPELGSPKRADVSSRGVRAAFPTFLGLAVTWDADRTEVTSDAGSDSASKKGE